MIKKIEAKKAAQIEALSRMEATKHPGMRPKKKPAKASVMEELQGMRDEIASFKNGRSDIRTTVGKARPPFTQKILNERMPPKLQVPQLLPYHSQGEFIDAIDHLRAFLNSEAPYGYSNAILCRSFLLSLARAVQTWYGKDQGDKG